MRLDELNHGQKKEFTPSNTKQGRTFNTFLTDCSESIAAMREAKSFLYRGSYENYGIFLGRPRKNRRAIDTSASLQREWDKIYSAAGFTALRSNSIFCSANINVASSYGHEYIIFPINGFSFTWSPKIYDLYNHMQQHDINDPSDLYVNLGLKKKIDAIADKMYISLTSTSSIIHDYGDPMYSLGYLFAVIPDEQSMKMISKILQKAKVSTNAIEKKYNVKLNKVHTAIKEISSLLNSSTMTPEEVIENYQYTNKDFVRALKSKNEIIINGEYYAFVYDEYRKYLWNALIK